jgi:hypothetical protein
MPYVLVEVMGVAAGLYSLFTSLDENLRAQ